MKLITEEPYMSYNPGYGEPMHLIDRRSKYYFKTYIVYEECQGFVNRDIDDIPEEFHSPQDLAMIFDKITK